MSESQLQFDLARGEAGKSAGMEAAALSKKELLEIARCFAYDIAANLGTVTADDVAECLESAQYGQLGNAAGSLFRGNEWEFTGEWRKSKRVSNHGHANRVWRLKK